jgi:hypothetical protein
MLLCSNGHATDRGYYYILKVSRDIQQFRDTKARDSPCYLLKRSRDVTSNGSVHMLRITLIAQNRGAGATRLPFFEELTIPKT